MSLDKRDAELKPVSDFDSEYSSAPFEFHSLLPFRWCFWLFENSWIKYVLLADFLFLFSITIFSSLFSNPAILVFVWLGTILVVMYVAHHTDRVLLYWLIRRFDYHLLVLYIVLYCISSLVQGLNNNSADSEYLSNKLTQILCLFLLSLTVISIDAFPFAPVSLKMAGLFFYIANGVRNFISWKLSPDPAPVTFCLWYCTDTQQLRSSALSILVLFSVKYLFCKIRYPEDCIILNSRIKLNYRFHKEGGAL